MKLHHLSWLLALGTLLWGCAERQDANLPYGPGGSVLVYLGRTPVRGVANDVAVIGDRAYVADEPFGISIYDLTNPAAPLLVDSLTLLSADQVDLLALDPTGRIAAVQTANNVQLYDLLQRRFLFPIGSANNVEIELQFSQDTLSIYRADNDALDGFNCDRFVNVSSDDTLRFGFTVFSAYFNQSVYGIALLNSDLAVVCRDLAGFSVVDYSAAGVAQLVSSLNTPGKVRDAALQNNLLCLAAGYEGLQTVDLSDPASPLLLGALRITNAADVKFVEIFGNRAYLMDANDGVFAVDLSDAAHPSLIGELRTSDPNNFCVAGDLLLIADEDMGLVIGQIVN